MQSYPPALSRQRARLTPESSREHGRGRRRSKLWDPMTCQPGREASWRLCGVASRKQLLWPPPQVWLLEFHQIAMSFHSAGCRSLDRALEDSMLEPWHYFVVRQAGGSLFPLEASVQSASWQQRAQTYRRPADAHSQGLIQMAMQVRIGSMHVNTRRQCCQDEHVTYLSSRAHSVSKHRASSLQKHASLDHNKQGMMAASVARFAAIYAVKNIV